MALELRLLPGEIHSFDGQGLACSPGKRHHLLDRFADARVGLLPATPVSDQRDLQRGARIAMPVGFGHGQMVSVDVAPHHPKPPIALGPDGQDFGGEEHAPAFCITDKAVADRLLPGKRRHHMIGSIRQDRSNAQEFLYAVGRDQGAWQTQPEGKAAMAQVFRHAPLATGGLVLRSQDEDMARPGTLPIVAPFIQRSVPTRLQMELRPEQPPAAKTHPYPVIGVIVLQTDQAVPEDGKATLLLVDPFGQKLSPRGICLFAVASVQRG